MIIRIETANDYEVVHDMVGKTFAATSFLDGMEGYLQGVTGLIDIE